MMNYLFYSSSGITIKATLKSRLEWPGDQPTLRVGCVRLGYSESRFDQSRFDQSSLGHKNVPL